MRPAQSLAARTGSEQPMEPHPAVRWPWMLAAIVLTVYPFLASPFFVLQIGAQALILGTIALSLSVLAGQAGMVSLSQMTVAGVAGYTMAILGGAVPNGTSLHIAWAWWQALPVALILATLAAAGIGLLAVRTEGVYTIMITLAVGVAFHYLVQQNVEIFNGYQGLSEIRRPIVGGLDFSAPTAFYYLCLVVAFTILAAVVYGLRTPFGLALQGIRDNPRRMRALGFNVTSHRVAAHALAGLMAATGGVLWLWYQGQISPGTVGTGAMINLLVVAVLGGLRQPVGAFVGALVFVLLQNFAIDLISRERFNLVIGSAFLAVVMFSPDGLLGASDRLRGAWRSRS